ncbi:MAG: hypothetical protein WCW26_01750, partial [Candidatus Buchananbacteria bacterium]
MGTTIVACYTNPDLDGFACVIAYTEFLNTINIEAASYIPGKPHDEAKFIMDKFNYIYPPKIDTPDAYDEIILVDSSDLKGLDKKLDPKNVVEII